MLVSDVDGRLKQPANEQRTARCSVMFSSSPSLSPIATDADFFIGSVSAIIIPYFCLFLQGFKDNSWPSCDTRSHHRNWWQTKRAEHSCAYTTQLASGGKHTAATKQYSGQLVDILTLKVQHHWCEQICQLQVIIYPRFQFVVGTNDSSAHASPDKCILSYDAIFH